MNESILSGGESNTEEPPPVAANPEGKDKGLTASSLMKIQALMDVAMSENVRSFTSRFTSPSFGAAELLGALIK